MFDRYKILGQRQSDGSFEGGDSVNWQGHYLYLSNQPFPFRMTFEVSFGGYVRHPDPASTDNGFGAFYKNPWQGVISRDQMIGIIAGLISQKDYCGSLRHLLHRLPMLFLFSYNTIDNGKDPETAKRKWPDPTGPNIWAIELRSFGLLSWIFWPFLLFLDLQLLIDTIKQNSREDDLPISYLMRLFISVDHVPTPTSILASWCLDKHKISERVIQYWSGWRDIPWMAELYTDKIKTL